MLFTLADALREIDLLSEAVVVAGKAGLDRPLRGVLVVDDPEVIPWLRQGDLLLTTAFALKDNPRAHLELIPALVDKGACGMAVAVGRYYQKVPPEMIQLADQLQLPLIALHWEVPFAEVIEAIHKQILNQQYALLEKSLHIQKVLTQLAVEGQGLDELAESLGRILGRSVTIENSSHKLMASASVGPMDEMGRRAVEEGGTPEVLVEKLKTQEVFDRLQRNPRPERIPAVPEMGMTAERILASIVVGTQLYGYVWIIATERALTQLDFMAIENATVVAALIMSRKQAVYEAEQRLKTSLLENLLDPDPYHALQDLTQRFRGLGLHRGYQLMALEPHPTIQSDPAHLVGHTYRLVTGRINAAGLKGTVVERGPRLVVLLATSDKDQGREVAKSISVECSRQSIRLAVGISSPSDQVTQVRQRYHEAMEALRVGKALSGEDHGVWTFEELGFLHWLRTVPPDLQMVSRYHRIVSEIVDHDQQNNTELFKTLETYLDSFGNAQQATRVLYIHRNTLRQRLSKIEDIWDLSLEDPMVMVNLLIAIKDWRLNRAP